MNTFETMESFPDDLKYTICILFPVYLLVYFAFLCLFVILKWLFTQK